MGMSMLVWISCGHYRELEDELVTINNAQVASYPCHDCGGFYWKEGPGDILLITPNKDQSYADIRNFVLDELDNLRKAGAYG